MSDWRVAAVVAGLVAIGAVVTGLGWALAGPGILIVLITWLNARDWSVYGRDPWDLPSSAPKVAETSLPSIDLEDELADLMRTARHRAIRLLEDDGRVEPFVMFEDADGEFRTRTVHVDNPEHTLARGRSAVQQVDSSAPRLVLVVSGVVELEGKPRPALLFEASEFRFSPRTFAFVQLYRPKRLIFPATALGPARYIGDELQAVRFAPDAASPSRAISR